jgi:Zn-finger protein
MTISLEEMKTYIATLSADQRAKLVAQPATKLVALNGILTCPRAGCSAPWHFNNFDKGHVTDGSTCIKNQKKAKQTSVSAEQTSVSAKKPNYKTVPCKFGAKCWKGKDCTFIHPEDVSSADGSTCIKNQTKAEQTSVSAKKPNYKTVPCKFGAKCWKGKDCTFIHPEDTSSADGSTGIKNLKKEKQTSVSAEQTSVTTEHPKYKTVPCLFGAKCRNVSLAGEDDVLLIYSDDSDSDSDL